MVDPSKSSWLRGDRGVTYAAASRRRTQLLQGNGGRPTMTGPPLISVYKDIADAFGI